MDTSPLHPTPYADVNAVLREFLSNIQAIVGDHFRAMYLDGYLALGDFAALRRRGNQTYTVLTLCRILYTLDSGAVVSKPVAARWAHQTMGGRWAALIEQARTWRKDPDRQDTPSAAEVDDTFALLEYTLAQCRRSTPSKRHGA